MQKKKMSMSNEAKNPIAEAQKTSYDAEDLILECDTKQQVQGENPH